MPPRCTSPFSSSMRARMEACSARLAAAAGPPAPPLLAGAGAAEKEEEGGGGAAAWAAVPQTGPPPPPVTPPPTLGGGAAAAVDASPARQPLSPSVAHGGALLPARDNVRRSAPAPPSSTCARPNCCRALDDGKLAGAGGDARGGSGPAPCGAAPPRRLPWLGGRCSLLLLLARRIHCLHWLLLLLDSRRSSACGSRARKEALQSRRIAARVPLGDAGAQVGEDGRGALRQHCGGQGRGDVQGAALKAGSRGASPAVRTVRCGLPSMPRVESRGSVATCGATLPRSLSVSMSERRRERPSTATGRRVRPHSERSSVSSVGMARAARPSWEHTAASSLPPPPPPAAVEGPRSALPRNRSVERRGSAPTHAGTARRPQPERSSSWSVEGREAGKAPGPPPPSPGLRLSPRRTISAKRRCVPGCGASVSAGGTCRSAEAASPGSRASDPDATHLHEAAAGHGNLCEQRQCCQKARREGGPVRRECVAVEDDRADGLGHVGTRRTAAEDARERHALPRKDAAGREDCGLELEAAARRRERLAQSKDPRGRRGVGERCSDGSGGRRCDAATPGGGRRGNTRWRVSCRRGSCCSCWRSVGGMGRGSFNNGWAAGRLCSDRRRWGCSSSGRRACGGGRGGCRIASPRRPRGTVGE